MTQRAWLVGVMSASVLMFGCGDDDGAAPPPTLNEVPALIADTLCDALLDCFGPGTPKNITRDSCRTSTLGEIQDGDFQYIQAAIDAGRITYNADRVQTCLNALASASCEELDLTHTAQCQEVFVGALDVGDLCGLDEECGSNAYCHMPAACPGTCTERGDDGDVCTSDDECGPGLKCNGVACATTVGAGHPCGGDTNNECALGLFCVGADDAAMTPGSCTAIESIFAGGDGDACSFEDSMLCQGGLVCAVTRVGTAAPTMACEATVGAGDACKLALPDQCPRGQYCDVSFMPLVLTSTCTPLPTDGEPCGGFQRLCAERHICDNGTCRAVNRIGGDCLNDSQCASGECNNGTCVAPLQCDPST